MSLFISSQSLELLKKYEEFILYSIYEVFTILKISSVIALLVVELPQVTDLNQYLNQDLAVVEQLLRGLSLNN